MSLNRTSNYHPFLLHFPRRVSSILSYLFCFLGSEAVGGQILTDWENEKSEQSTMNKNLHFAENLEMATFLKSAWRTYYKCV